MKVSENTIKNNCLIADFIGYRLESTLQGNWVYPVKINDEIKFFETSKLEFHCNCNWLKPAIERLEQLGFQIDTDLNIYVQVISYIKSLSNGRNIMIYDGCIDMFFSKEDIASVADDEGINLTNEQINDIAEILGKIGANVGINWDVISDTIYNYLN